jgi:hypothetical protein
MVQDNIVYVKASKYGVTYKFDLLDEIDEINVLPTLPDGVYYDCNICFKKGYYILIINYKKKRQLKHYFSDKLYKERLKNIFKKSYSLLLKYKDCATGIAAYKRSIIDSLCSLEQSYELSKRTRIPQLYREYNTCKTKEDKIHKMNEINDNILKEFKHIATKEQYKIVSTLFSKITYK